MHARITFPLIGAFFIINNIACTLTPDVPTASPTSLIVSNATDNDIACPTPPTGLTVAFPNLIPEGIEFDPIQCRFLLSSLSMGVIVAVEDDGSFTTLVDDPNVGSIAGLHLDGRRILACLSLANGNPGFGIYDADDGTPLAMFDLSSLAGQGSSLINDCTVDADGNAFITDSMAAAIYRITPIGEASVFLAAPELAGATVGANGIEFIADNNVLVVGNTNAGALFRIPLDDPQAFTQVQIDATINTDGMLLHPSGDLVITGSVAIPGSDSITGLVSVSSSDGWMSATVVGTVATSARPTTSALRGTDIFPVFPFLIESFTGTMVTQFPVLRVPTTAAD